MARKTISISEEAYSEEACKKLKSLKASEKESFSDVILKYYLIKRKLSEVIAKTGSNTELANAIEKTSRDNRGKDEEVDLDAGA